jgi:hypothetical protein
VIFEPGKEIISWHILHQHRYTCPIALPLRRKPEHGSILTLVSATSASPLQLLHHQRNICHPVVNRFTRQTLPTVNRKYFFMNVLCVQSFCPQKPHNRTLLFSNTLLKHCRHFDYWNQPLNMWMRLCNLDYHEDGLCCSLVIQTENQFRPLQLSYFHLWPNYWLSLVNTRLYSYPVVALAKRKLTRPRFRRSL